MWFILSGSFSPSPPKPPLPKSEPKHPVRDAMTIKVTSNGACFLILVELLEEEITLLKGLVMMSTGTVDVSMCQFLLGSRANLDNLDFEAEGLAGHLVVEVC